MLPSHTLTKSCSSRSAAGREGGEEEEQEKKKKETAGQADMMTRSMDYIL